MGLFCKESTYKSLSYRFYVPKAVVLRCNIGTFTEQNRLFCNAKQWVLQRLANQIVTPLLRFGEIFTFL